MAIIKASKSGFIASNQEKYIDFLAGNKPYNPYFFVAYQSSNQYAYSGNASLDSSGNIYMPGSFNNGSRAVGFLGKVSATGTSTYQKTLTNPSGSVLFYAGTLDSAQTTFYAGMTTAGIGITSYTSAGAVNWQYWYRSPNATNNAGSTWGMATDSSNNVYAVGYGDGVNWNRLWLVKTNSSGTFQWGLEAGSAGSFGECVGVDSSDNVYVGGLTDAGTNGAFLAKLNSSGSVTWKKLLNPGGGNYIWWDSMNVNSSNSTVTVVGHNSSAEVVFAQYDFNGNLNWQRSTNASGTNALGVAIDASNNIYVAFVVSSGVNIIKFDSSGTVQWQRRITSTLGSLDMAKISVLGNFMYVTFVLRNGTPQQGLICTYLPTDGSGVGSTYEINSSYTFNYSIPTMTISTPTYTHGNNSSSTTSPSFTRTTLAYTEANGSTTFGRS